MGVQGSILNEAANRLHYPRRDVGHISDRCREHPTYRVNLTAGCAQHQTSSPWCRGDVQTRSNIRMGAGRRQSAPPSQIVACQRNGPDGLALANTKRATLAYLSAYRAVPVLPNVQQVPVETDDVCHAFLDFTVQPPKRMRVCTAAASVCLGGSSL